MKSFKQKDWQARFAQRRKAILKTIADSIAIFPSASEAHFSRDQNYHYRQNSDFLYLTGINEPHCVLVLLGKRKGPRSILYLRERDKRKEQWDGETLGLLRAKRRLDIDEVRSIESFAAELPELFRDAASVHYAPGSNSTVDALVWEQLKNPLAPQTFFPSTLSDSRLLTSTMRVKKDKIEIQAIKHACEISARGFQGLLSELQNQKSEQHAARTLESYFARYGGEGASFETIIASGKNATTLHHRPGFQPLWKRELVLIDAGSTYRGYAADLTRTVPVSGTFSDPQAQVYDIVHEALDTAILASKPGESLFDIHNAAVKVLTKGLIALGILQGPLSRAIRKLEYKPYYMHQTSHWLGLDVHDIAPITCDEHRMPSKLHPLDPGAVFTIEPGLYFSAKDKSVPEAFRGIGIRLEEDILITKSGCTVLSSRLPVERLEIQKLIA